MERFSLRDLSQATGGRLRDVDAGDARFDHVMTDSRDIQPGQLFWALKGEHHEGHDFCHEALEKQARLCVVSTDRADSIRGPVLIVDDTLRALGRFAHWHRCRSDALVIGITGSVGKTTTREFVFAALNSQFQGIRSRKNFNNLIGLPLSLLDLDHAHEFAALEMGASALGDIRELCQIGRPEIGVVTAIGPAHLQSFGSIEGIIQTKGELLEELPSTGFAVLPGDNEIVRQMADRAPCQVIFVGEGDDNHIRATDVQVLPGRLQFRCEGERFDIPVNGRHVLSNALCAIGIGLEVGVPVRTLAAGLSRFVPAPGRAGLSQIGPWTVIDDTYNASPLSVAAGCRMLRDFELPAVRQRYLVLGDMRELGDTSVHEHEQIGRLAADLKLDRVLACGQFAADVARGARQAGMKSHQITAASDVETLLTVLDCWLEPDDMLLVKGSRSTRMERVIEWLKARAQSQDWLLAGPQQRFCA